ncbi:sugar transferase [Flavobacterium praedii]|uniref:sugar transferase n=1 Tax=Flavobacterium praedii TaxID=3002900 RepID=UPI002481A3B4|nr:sugar transferase [Flavobacterium praedii]
MLKRVFDIGFSILMLFVFSWLLLTAWFLAVIDTQTNGIFTHDRIGQFGRKFKIYKLRTIQINSDGEGKGIKISKIGQLLRNYKLDELPQFFNVLKGEMSVVGPRPDIEGYYDLLEGENRKILDLKPGLTSLASLKYYNEDKLLDIQENPLRYNDEVLFPDKLKLNLAYYHHQSLYEDLKIIVATGRFVVVKIIS